MNMKKVIILSLLALMVLGCISTVSAGMFDFLKQDTKIDINNTSNGSLYVDLKGSNESIANKTVAVEVVSHNESKNYTVNSSTEPVLVCTLIPGEYNITAKFAGDDQYKEIYTTKSINVTELSQKAVEETVNDLSKEVNK
ncbi:hypothetical protein [Methanosphaera sp. BMS]|uniref:hypothetical protein n=1 Tax=Methanosphaera sp. BMS TaxID=1789762 RepID=UPI000DC1CF54|nr:hypothetical protein [Methanosphaera sp. BMS]AWX31780.1 hypothetical protein AW729_01160 [Methanosphaera sp. BMS]